MSLKKMVLFGWLALWAIIAFIQISLGGLILSVGSEAAGGAVSNGWSVAAMIAIILVSAFQAAVFTFVIGMFIFIGMCLYNVFKTSPTN